MSKKPAATQQTGSKLETFLGWGAVILIGASALSYFTILAIAAVQSLRGTPGGAYQALAWVAYIGMPIGFLLLFILLFLNIRKRGKQQAKK